MTITYRSIQETLFLVSVPTMREKIIEGLNTPLEECLEDRDGELNLENCLHQAGFKGQTESNRKWIWPRG